VILATDSEGEHFTGKFVHLVGNRYHLRRQRLQKLNTKNAKRRLRQIRRREARFQQDPNHGISQQLVHKATEARKASALEDLWGIRERTPVQRAHRYQRHAWAFSHLRAHSTYKAAQADVPVRLVDPGIRAGHALLVGTVSRRIVVPKSRSSASAVALLRTPPTTPRATSAENSGLQSIGLRHHLLSGQTQAPGFSRRCRREISFCHSVALSSPHFT
jgi:IS605 OrfB family transposase